MSGLYLVLCHSVLSEEHHMAMSSFWAVIKPSRKAVQLPHTPPHLPCIRVQTAHFKAVLDGTDLLHHMPYISNCANF